MIFLNHNQRFLEDSAKELSKAIALIPNLAGKGKKKNNLLPQTAPVNK